MTWADIVAVKLSFGVICTVLVREYSLSKFTSARTFDGILHLFHSLRYRYAMAGG